MLFCMINFLRFSSLFGFRNSSYAAVVGGVLLDCNKPGRGNGSRLKTEGLSPSPVTPARGMIWF
jgi:hypothetical protein